MDDVFHFMFHGQQEKILQEVKIGDFALKVKAIDDYQGSFERPEQTRRLDLNGPNSPKLNYVDFIDT